MTTDFQPLDPASIPVTSDPWMAQQNEAFDEYLALAIVCPQLELFVSGVAFYFAERGWATVLTVHPQNAETGLAHVVATAHTSSYDALTSAIAEFARDATRMVLVFDRVGAGSRVDAARPTRFRFFDDGEIFAGMGRSTRRALYVFRRDAVLDRIDEHYARDRRDITSLACSMQLRNREIGYSATFTRRRPPRK
jgi:hypothetical protein